MSSAIRNFLEDQEHASKVLVGWGAAGMALAFTVAMSAYFILR